jgi:hypothetical protein
MGTPKRHSRPAPRRAGKKHDKSAEKSQRLAAEARALRVRERELKAALDRYHHGDIPEFRSWIAEHLAYEREELRRLLQAAADLEAALDAGEFAYHSGLAPTLREAVSQVRAEMEREREEEEEEEDGDCDFDGDQPSEGAHPNGGPPRLDAMPEEVVDFLFGTFMAEARGIDIDAMRPDDYARARAEFTATFEHAASGNRAAFQKALYGAGADRSARNTSIVKAAYRRVVKLLHPDRKGELDEEEKELWEAASAGYQAFDVQAIEEVEVILLLVRDEPVPPGMVPALRRYRDRLDCAVAEAEDEVEDARTNPAWEFSAKPKTKALLKRLRTAIRLEIEHARTRLANLEWHYAQVTRPPRRRRPARKSSGGKKPGAAGPPRRPSRTAPEPPGDAPQPGMQSEFPF